MIAIGEVIPITLPLPGAIGTLPHLLVLPTTTPGTAAAVGATAGRANRIVPLPEAIPMVAADPAIVPEAAPAAVGVVPEAVQVAAAADVVAIKEH
jgi:hypothetical protein